MLLSKRKMKPLDFQAELLNDTKNPQFVEAIWFNMR